MAPFDLSRPALVLLLAATIAASETHTYQKGTIEGFDVRRDVHVSGGGGGGNGTPVSTWTRNAKVYELRGEDLIYRVDYCGAFQAGEFSPGQVVEYRVDGKHVYIRHDNDKEYRCQLEGTRNVEHAKTETPVQPVSSAAAPAPAVTTANFSVNSVPTGADIEVDGTFVGNTPSDLRIDQGDHSITVKKSGYKPWERKMKVSAGSKIQLNAEMEKDTTP